ncbi:hypothetical protein Taro_041433 [Colocasia esculenta]|uniref:Uncharacterized protein n=1 Tax=Colocasia esculenta TaxID=4460 RepID=A0A843WLN7_COLES|nr:hypothetical protein [Colocasia esculenta]
MPGFPTPTKDLTIGTTAHGSGDREGLTDQSNKICERSIIDCTLSLSRADSSFVVLECSGRKLVVGLVVEVHFGEQVGDALKQSLLQI